MKETNKKALWANEGPDELDKRFYVPGVVLTSKCPECGVEKTVDLTHEYMSYPTIGKNEITFTHEIEDGENYDTHDWTVEVDLIVGIHVRTKNDKKTA